MSPADKPMFRKGRDLSWVTRELAEGFGGVQPNKKRQDLRPAASALGRLKWRMLEFQFQPRLCTKL